MFIINILKKSVTHLRRYVRFSIIIIIATAIIGALIAYFFKPTYSVTLNGEFIGYTRNKSSLQSKINEVIQKGDGQNVAFKQISLMPQYQLCLLKKDVETNDDEIFQKVTSSGTPYYKYYAITEDDEEKAYVAEFSEAEDVVNQLKEKSSTNADKIGIVEKYSTEKKEYTPIETCVANLYKKKEPVKKASATYKKAPKGGNPGPSVPTNLGVSLVKPISGTISSRFGIRSRDNHKGLDIAAPAGTAIMSSAEGTVIFSGYGSNTNGYSGYGNTVAVKSNNSVIILYAHCSALYVRTGQKVSQGQVIAAVGSTGISTGNHLHFEIRYNGRAVNPQNYLY